MPAVTVVERDYPNLYKRFTVARAADGQARQRRQGHGLEHRARGRAPEARSTASSPRRAPTKGLARIDTDIDAAEVILMLAPETNGEVAVKAWESLGKAHRPRARPSRAAEGGREDPLPRRRRAAAQDHLVADLVGAREREGLLQRRLHQRARADPVAHADRPPAALPGSSVDARLRRGLLRLPPADRHCKTVKPVIDTQAERREADRAQLHHAAPEVGHPLHLHRQPADADAVARRADRLDQRDRRARRPASSITTGSRPTTPTARWSPAPSSRSASRRACA